MFQTDHNGELWLAYFSFNVPNQRLLLLKRKIDAGLSHKKAPPKRSLNGAPFY
jgi:hypothetical protein